VCASCSGRRSSSRSPDVATAAEARRHLTIIARAPRPAGGDAEAEARRYCASVLEALGCSVMDVPIEFSAFPGRYATPVLGGVAAASIAATAMVAAAGAGVWALVVLAVSLLAVATAGSWLARRGVSSMRVLRARSANLVARRGAARVWLVAHLDSKSQPVPIVVRVAGLISLGIVWLAAAGLAIAAMAGYPVGPFGAPIALASGVAALPVVLSVVGSRSHGARDNASGVAAVLCAVAELPAECPIGVILTSAEELGLAGARALASSGPPPATAINVDTVDDAGEISIMYGGGCPRELIEAFTAGGAAGERIVVRRLVPGILTDGVALADGGWRVVTVSKATMGTLARVHTAADTVAGMSGDGIGRTATLLARAAGTLHRLGA
jgi:hypothetical protein